MQGLLDLEDHEGEGTVEGKEGHGKEVEDKGGHGNSEGIHLDADAIRNSQHRLNNIARGRLLGDAPSPSASSPPSSSSSSSQQHTTHTSSVDWSTSANPAGRSVMTKVFNQAWCNNCWAVAAATAMEAHYALKFKTERVPKVSIAQVVPISTDIARQHTAAAHSLQVVWLLRVRQSQPLYFCLRTLYM